MIRNLIKISFILFNLLIPTGIFAFQKPFVLAQSETTIQNITFHNYSLDYKANNESYYIYNGADTQNPKLTNAFKVSPRAQISGLVTTFGFEWTYWSGAVIWTYNLEQDLHVKGTVQMTVHMSSSDMISGLFAGGGFGMGLVEMDENKKEINRFLNEGGSTLGSNPLSSTPQAYTLSIPMDHVFPKEHLLGFFVGVGGTEPNYNFTIYFDSAQQKSGAIIPIVKSSIPTPSPSTTPTNTPSSTPSVTQSPFPSQNSSVPTSNLEETNKTELLVYTTIILVSLILISVVTFRFLKNRKNL